MLETRRRLVGRLSCWAVAVIVACGFGLRASGQSGTGTTTVADTVYLADGSAASGSLIISWPAFVTSEGAAVAAGNTSTTLGANGALNVALVPNAGATPAGVYYSVVYQMGPGQVKTEYWVVPATSPADLATVRTTPGSGVAAQPVSVQYVNSALATKADDSEVVHLNGTETIGGTKTFASAPSVPAPTSAGQVATKGYVDQSIANVGAGNYLPTAGGTMTGPITLPANPSAPMQAVPKQYVDFGIAGKADLIAGLVPASELGSGSPAAGSCLIGNGTSSGAWGACASGGGTGNVSTTPIADQNVAQPAGTQFSTNNLANVRYVTANWNWSQSPADSLATAGSNTIHLNPCPLGIDTSANPNRPYSVYIAGTGVAEAALVTGGSCASGMAGTVVVTTVNTHPAGYTVGSSTSGIQEALNDAGPVGGGVVIPPTGANGNALPVYSTIYVQSAKSSLRGEGKPVLLCKTRSVCLFIGDRVNPDDFPGIEVSGLRFAAGNNFDGIPITNTACSANTATITLNNTGASAVQAGDYVDINWTFTMHYFGIHKVTSASATQFTYADANCGGLGTIASQASAGFASLENAAIEDNGAGSSLRDLYMTDKGAYAAWGGLWQNNIVVDNDQAFKLDTLMVDNGPNCTANYCGQSIYFPGPFNPNAAVAWLSHLNLSLNCGGNGVTDFAGNTLRIENSVIQAFRQWGVYDGTPRGGYGGGQFDDLYEEVGNCTNPMYPGSGAQKQGMAGLVNAGNSNSIHGGEFPIGQVPQFAATGNQATQYNYCFVVHDTSYGVSKCLTAGFAKVDSASPSGSIVVSWPRVQGTGTVSYDLVRYVGSGNTRVGPYAGACAGGSATACGSVATELAQCTTNLCSYTDSASASTSNYAMAAPTYVPGIFWLPGGLVSLLTADVGHFGTVPTFIDDDTVLDTPLSPISTESGLNVPQVFAQRCSSGNANEWVSCAAGNSNGSNAAPDATVLQSVMAVGGMTANLKGRLNFLGSQSAAVNSGEIITLVDSNPAKTLATSGNRPTVDAADTYLGLDTGSVNYGGAGLAVGAPASISSYINSTPNGTSYLERLTASAKTFKVPVTVNGNLSVTGGTMTLPITGSGSQCLHVNSTGVVSGTGSDCGSGNGGTSGTVNNGSAGQVAMYSANGTAVSGDATLSDDGLTLNYSGSGGIAVQSATIAGNLSVGGQLALSGPWMVDSPIPSFGMGSATSGTSSLGVSSDGNFYISANGSAPAMVATTESPTFTGTTTFTGAISGTNANFSGNVTVGGQIIGTGPWAVSGPVPGMTITPAAGTSQAGFDTNGTLTVSENGGAAVQVAKVNSNITGTAANLSGTQTANFIYAAPNGASGAAGFRAIVAGDVPTLNQNTTGSAGSLSAASALPNGTTAATQTAGDSSTKLATDAFVTTNFAGMSVTGSVGDYPKVTGNNPTPTIADSGVLAGPYSIPWITAVRGGGNATFAQNVVKMWGVVLTFPVRTSNLTYDATAADNTGNNYDVGIANASGTIVLNIGATPGTTFAPSAPAAHTIAWTQGTTVLQPGKYYIVLTTNCASSCATIAADGSSSAVTFLNAATAGTTSGGALTSFTPPGDAWSWGAALPALAVR